MNIAIFASGGGSNFQAIHARVAAGDARGVIVSLLVTNNSSCGAASFARRHGIPVLHISAVTDPDPQGLERRMLEVLKDHGIELIVLAGYMKLLPREVVRGYPDRILNIHPALLPRFGGGGMYGLRVHRAVLAAGEKMTGVTVHVVDEVYDRGRILEQREVEVLPGDTAEVLQKRVLETEHDLYWRVIEGLARNLQRRGKGEPV